MAPHTEPNRLLIAVQECSESFGVLVTALVGDVPDQNSIPAHLLKLAQVALQE